MGHRGARGARATQRRALAEHLDVHELELTYEGEEIGWIVRGEVSEELRRFLDRWERTLRDDVASRVQRDEGRVDDGDEGKVSIWLGDLHDEAELAALLVPASPRAAC